MLPKTPVLRLTLAVAAVLLTQARVAHAVTYNWSPVGVTPFAWNAGGNWLTQPVDDAAFPNAAGDWANLNTLDVTVAPTINLNNFTTVGRLSVGDTVGTTAYTIAPNGSFNFIFSSGATNVRAILENSGGANVISSNVILFSDVTATLASGLTLSGQLSNGTLIKNGAGTLTIGGSNTGNSTSLILNAGTVSVTRSNNVVGGTNALGNVVVNNGGTLSADTPDAFANSGNIPSSGTAVINSGGVFDLKNTTGGYSIVTINGGAYQNLSSASVTDHVTILKMIGGSITGTGLKVQASFNVFPASSAATISALAGTATIADVQDGSPLYDLDVAGGLLESIYCLKSNSGTMLVRNGTAPTPSLSTIGSASTQPLYVGGGTLIALAPGNTTTSAGAIGTSQTSGSTATTTTISGGTLQIDAVANAAGVARNVQTGNLTIGSARLILTNNAIASGLIGGQAANTLTFQLGNGTNGGTFTRNANGSLTLATNGTLGSTATGGVRFIKGTGAAFTNTVTGNYNAWMVAQASLTDTTGSYVVYQDNTAGFVTSAGTSHATDFITTANENARVTANAIVTDGGAAARAYSLRVDNGVTATLNGTVQLGTGSGQAGVLLNGATISGGTALAFGGAEGLIYAGSNTGSTISSAITGSAGIVKFGQGTLTLSTTNSYTGGTFFNEGVIKVSANGQLGTTSGGLTFQSGTLNATESFTITSGRSLGGTGTIDVDSTKTLIYQGNASATLIKAGAGTLQLEGNNSIDIYLRAGTLRLGSNTAFASGTATASGGTISDGGVARTGTNAITFVRDLAGNTPVVSFDSTAGLSFSGAVMLAANTEVNVSAGKTTLSGALNGLTYDLTKSGPGTLVLTGNSSVGHSGGLIVNAGALVVSGSLSAQTSVIVESGGTLMGSGTVGGLYAHSGGTISPTTGSTTSGSGILSTSEDFSFSSGATLSLNIAKATAGSPPVQGTDYDTINVTGSGTGGDTLQTAAVSLAGTLSLTIGTGVQYGDLYFIVINNGSDAISGTFNGLANGTTFSQGGQQFQICYAGNWTGTAATSTFTGGNDAALMAVPEPGSAVELLAGFGVLAGLRGFRRRASSSLSGRRTTSPNH